MEDQIQLGNHSHIRVGVFDVDGVLRSKLISKEKLIKVQTDGFGFCDVIFGWDVTDSCYSAIKDFGYPDEKVTLDQSTLRFIPWQDNRPFILGDFNHNKTGLSKACPRSLLKRTLSSFKEMGIEVKVGMDIEWFNFKKESYSSRKRNFKLPTPISQGMFGYSSSKLNENQNYVEHLLSGLEAFDIPLEGLHTETGDGVYEAAIAYDSALKFADKAALFKSSVKEIANIHGIVPSFMAKWNPSLPGCSGHLHISLWKEGTNLFYEEGGLSELAKQFIAGQLKALPEVLPMYAPTVNSYKRYVPGSWSAVTVSWGHENRTTAIRVVDAIKPEDYRVEMRVPGADANPYLSISAALASGLFGIENKLDLRVKATKGDEYQSSNNEKLPDFLAAATAQMNSSELAEQLFGKDFISHFVMTREWEWNEFKKAVTDWELKRYFEVI